MSDALYHKVTYTTYLHYLQYLHLHLHEYLCYTLTYVCTLGDQRALRMDGGGVRMLFDTIIINVTILNAQ